MPAERAPMGKVREVLRLKHALGASERQIAMSVGVSRSTIAEYLRKYNLPIELHVGRTPEIIHLAHSCVAVSGSVGLELLYRDKPTVVLSQPGAAKPGTDAVVVETVEVEKGGKCVDEVFA